MTSTRLRAETFPIGSLACNCTLIWSTQSLEAIAIDPGNDKAAFMKQVQGRGLKLVALVHTHAHFDHIGQSTLITAETGAPSHLHKDDLFLYRGLQQQGLFFGVQLPEPGEIDVLLEDEQTVQVKAEIEDAQLKKVLKVLHTPGHTPGSCCFYSEHFEQPILFSGDTLFRGSIGRTDLPGGDFEMLEKSIKHRVYALPDETEVITGHGPKTRLFEEKRNNPFVRI